MSETPPPSPFDPVADLPGVELSSSVLVSLATPSVLLAILGTQAIGEMLQSLGQASEEIFRGDRLPVLHFPPRNSENS
ncbi:hypothetical protein JJD41_23590 [Oxynema sp. CENA135]|jgi:hypothetical protein|uniref:hypothetical protein n=1 Tax=Oxynema sp. CENA135 TaxID=984206 RepID=UPI0019098FD6|nr:hypothetical protein [Oxynema sp. CENA135]MBK4732827.1 hypothetical protein [Oxynema sp. CENA135]